MRHESVMRTIILMKSQFGAFPPSSFLPPPLSLSPPLPLFFIHPPKRINGDDDGKHKNEVHVIAFNPESESRLWSDNDRLNYVRVEYRPLGTNIWFPAQNASGDPLLLPLSPANEVMKRCIILNKSIIESNF
jgi:hypothetical protein